MSDKALPPPPTPQIVDHTPPTTSTERCTLYERLSLLNDKSKAAVSKKIDSELEQQNEDPRVKRKKDIAIRIFLLGLLSYVIASVVFIDAVSPILLNVAIKEFQAFEKWADDLNRLIGRDTRDRGFQGCAC